MSFSPDVTLIRVLLLCPVLPKDDVGDTKVDWICELVSNKRQAWRLGLDGSDAMFLLAGSEMLSAD